MPASALHVSLRQALHASRALEAPLAALCDDASPGRPDRWTAKDQRLQASVGKALLGRAEVVQHHSPNHCGAVLVGPAGLAVQPHAAPPHRDDLACGRYVSGRVAGDQQVQRPPPLFGNAIDLFGVARAEGFQLDDHPTPGAMVVYGSAYGVFGHIGTVRAVRGDRYEVVEQNFLDFDANLEPHWQTFDLRSVAWPDPAVVGFVVAPPVG